MRQMTVLHAAQDRIEFAAEGFALAAADALDAARDRIALVLAAVAALAATAVLLLSGGEDWSAVDTAASAQQAAAAGGNFVEEPGFSVSLPEGWKAVEAPDGATFAAASTDGLAETTLWAERDPALSFNAFVEQSIASLDEIGTNVRIADQVGGTALASRITELHAEVPLDGGVVAPYRVTLRAAGPYRFYLATSIQPGAPAQRLADAELLGGSFRPTVEVRDAARR